MSATNKATAISVRTSESPTSEDIAKGLRNLRRGLLHLHKALLDAERVLYEQAHGRVLRGELLQLVINHEQFAWLHSISEIIVRIDEAMDADEPMTGQDSDLLLAQVRVLLKPSETGSEFQRRYYAALQREPAAVLAHREAMLTLSAP